MPTIQKKSPAPFLFVVAAAAGVMAHIGSSSSDPTPGPGPAPIPADGFRCLIVYESSDLSKYPADQVAAMQGQAVRGYLNAKCIAGADSKTKEWRIWSSKTDVSNESKLWQDVMKRKRDSLPWIVISDGKTGYEGPLPKNSADTLSLLQKYGGP